jgi:hypothetical protein
LRRPLAVLAGAFVVVGVVGCSSSKTAAPTTTIATTTTSTIPPVVSNLMVDGVRPGVLQAPFYPPITVTQVVCGVDPKGGRFVRIDLPAGASGTPGRTVLTEPTAVLVTPGEAVLFDPRFSTRYLYTEGMANIATSTAGVFVLTLGNYYATGGDGLTVVVGNVQINGDYQCPATDVVYPGT